MAAVFTALIASLAAAYGLSGATVTGVNAQAEPADFRAVGELRARLVRLHIEPREAGSRWLLRVARDYARVGARIQPVVTFDGTMLTPAEVKDLVALDRIPGLQDVELGNETSYGYQYRDGYTDSSYKERARVYAVRVKEAAEALNPHGIGVLAQAEDGGSGSPVWVQEMFASVPDLSQYVAGWTIHPYPDQRTAGATDTYGVPKMRRMVADLAEQGDTTTPIDVTEWGVPSDGGARLEQRHASDLRAGRADHAHHAAEPPRRGRPAPDREPARLPGPRPAPAPGLRRLRRLFRRAHAQRRLEGTVHDRDRATDAGIAPAARA